MPETPRALLMQSLLGRYDELRDRLTRRLGSADLASDALHETWLRLQSRPDLAPVKNPAAYVYRAALNTAANLRKTENRRLTRMDIDALLAIADPAPGPAIIAEDRAEVAAMAAALTELTERQQVIFHESFLGDASHRELAARFGVTVRTVQIDLQKAVEHCARHLGKRNAFVSGRGRLSGKREGPST
jgi:RNA polymerase sigma-70 factor (ECF subfamily)